MSRGKSRIQPRHKQSHMEHTDMTKHDYRARCQGAGAWRVTPLPPMRRWRPRTLAKHTRTKHQYSNGHTTYTSSTAGRDPKSMFQKS